MTEKQRAYIYRILIAVGTLVMGYGFINANELAMWLGLVTAILNIMPSANTSTGDKDGTE